jgi:hypothetical protein
MVQYEYYITMYVCIGTVRTYIIFTVSFCLLRPVQCMYELHYDVGGWRWR